MRWVDVTIPMRNGMTVWPGDGPFVMEPVRRIDQGDSCNVSRISLTTHTGTHVDAPWHFEKGGAPLHEMDHRVFFGEATVIDLPGVDIIRAADLPRTPLPPRVLFKTRNSSRPADAPFDQGFVALDTDAAERLVRDGVRLVGVDYLSVAPFKQPGQDTHHALLGAGVLVVEGLRLADVPPGRCLFTVLPLPVIDADGAPCRAFVGLEETI